MLQINNKYLGQVCEIVPAKALEENDFGLLARKMLATCWRGQEQIAVGLAANQLGLDIRMIVVDYAGFKGCMINPQDPKVPRRNVPGTGGLSLLW